MNIQKLGKDNFEELVEEAVLNIKKGSIVILPFDTVYGIVGDPKNEESVKKIFEIKSRPTSQTIGLAVSNMEKFKEIACLSEREENLIENRAPGPFTFIVNGKENTEISHLCQKNGTFGIRITSSELVNEIANRVGGIIAQTSANKNGLSFCLNIDEIKEQFTKKELESFGLIIDGGQLLGHPSDIIDLITNCPKVIERK